RAQHGRGARFVELHGLHVQRRLDRDTAGIERHALADEDDRRATSALILQHDKPWLFGTALPDGEGLAHPFLLFLRAIEIRHAELVLLGELAGLVGEVARRANVARLHLQIPREQIPGRDRVADGASRLSFLFVARLDDQLARFHLWLRALRLLPALRQLA